MPVSAKGRAAGARPHRDISQGRSPGPYGLILFESGAQTRLGCLLVFLPVSRDLCAPEKISENRVSLLQKSADYVIILFAF